MNALENKSTDNIFRWEHCDNLGKTKEKKQGNILGTIIKTHT